MLPASLIAILSGILTTNVIFPILVKKVAVLPGRVRNLLLQYSFAAIFAWLAAYIGHRVIGTNFEWRTQMLFVGAMGIANGFACYMQWKAIAINLALTSISTWLDDVIALMLALMILKEFHFVDAWIAAGILLALGSCILFATQKESLDSIGSDSVFKIYKYILLYSVIWGGAAFSMRYFSLKENMSVWDFLPSWYSGSLIGALFVYYFADPSERGNLSELPEAAKKVAMLTLSVVSSLAAGYWARSLVPLVYAQPIFQVSEMVFPTLIGLFIFREKKNFTRLGWLLMFCGLIGGLIIATHL